MESKIENFLIRNYKCKLRNLVQFGWELVFCLAGKTTAIRRVAVRETGSSQEYGDSIEGSQETLRTITTLLYSGALGGPLIWPPLCSIWFDFSRSWFLGLVWMDPLARLRNLQLLPGMLRTLLKTSGELWGNFKVLKKLTLYLKSWDLIKSFNFWKNWNFIESWHFISKVETSWKV